MEFILVEPAEPGNVGASARAMKNMGFRKLGVVRGPDASGGEGRWFAHNAADVLENAKNYETLKEALGDKALVVGTTRRKGKKRGVIVRPDQAAGVIYRTAKGNRVAVVFGREDRGLVNEEIEECGLLVTIPSSESHPSLNLSHAVILIAYEISRAPYIVREDTQIAPIRGDRLFWGAEEFVNQADLSVLYERILRVLTLLEYLPRGDEDLKGKIMGNIKRFIGRAGITPWEVKMLHGLCSAVEKRCQR